MQDCGTKAIFINDLGSQKHSMTLVQAAGDEHVEFQFEIIDHWEGLAGGG